MCLPSAKYLSDQGHEVWFEVRPQFRDIFELTSYVRPANETRSSYDKVLDLSLDGERLDQFMHGQIRLQDWFASLYPETRPSIGHDVVLDQKVETPDYGMPEDAILISPYAYNHPAAPGLDWFLHVARHRTGRRHGMFVLSDKPRNNLAVPVITAMKISHLPGIIERAREFFTVQSAPTHIAAAVRQTYYHVYRAGFPRHCNFSAPSQIVLHGMA